MTLKNRNRLLFLAFFFTIIPISLYFYSLSSLVQIQSRSIFLITKPIFIHHLTIEVILSGIYLLLSLSSAGIIFWNFRKTISIEIFFIICFLISFSFFSIRNLLPIYYLEKMPQNYQIYIIKLIHFIHYLSLILLFFAGFYKMGFETTKSEWSFIVAVLVCYVMIQLTPTDYSQFLKALSDDPTHLPSILNLNAPNQPHFTLFLTILISILAPINFIISWFQSRSIIYLILSLLITLLIISSVLIAFQLYWPIQIVALIIFFATLTGFSIITHQHYKWS